MTPCVYSLTAVATSRPSATVDEDGAAGLGTEVDPEGVAAAQGSITTFRPQRSRSAAKASDHSSSA